MSFLEFCHWSQGYKNWMPLLHVWSCSASIPIPVHNKHNEYPRNRRTTTPMYAVGKWDKTTHQCISGVIPLSTIRSQITIVRTQTKNSPSATSHMQWQFYIPNDRQYLDCQRPIDPTRKLTAHSKIQSSSACHQTRQSCAHACFNSHFQRQQH